jgi:ABC-type amino acid transport system permease subunit
LNSALREYKENGTVQSIIDKYINDRSEDSTEEFDNWWDEFKAEFEQNFIEKDRWKYLTDGLLMTIQITFFSLIIGIVIGVIVSALRSTYDKNFVEYRKKGGFKYYILKFFNTICHIYISVIRGTPMVVQLLIMYYVIFASSENAMLIATISFGINSGAYVAEIIRGGIMSIDGGQFEAGRSLGLNYPQTMYYVILPQAIKNVLPSLCNEFIVLIKETSIAGYVGIADLTKGGDIIRGTTFSAFMPLIAVALIYLVIVLVLTKLVGILEKRLRKNERTYE